VYATNLAEDESCEASQLCGRRWSLGAAIAARGDRDRFIAEMAGEFASATQAELVVIATAADRSFR
jgi:hypothetical protein